MKIEEVDGLMGDISAELERLGDDTEVLDRNQRKHRIALLARKNALERVRAAMAEGDSHKETRALLDYGLWTEYGERNFLLFNLVKSQMGWRLWW
jgi:hypothetical protein